jgi:hypothetical protein
LKRKQLPAQDHYGYVPDPEDIKRIIWSVGEDGSYSTHAMFVPIIKDLLATYDQVHQRACIFQYDFTEEVFKDQESVDYIRYVTGHNENEAMQWGRVFRYLGSLVYLDRIKHKE